MTMISRVFFGAMLMGGVVLNAMADHRIGFSISIGGPGYAFTYVDPAPFYYPLPPVVYAPPPVYYSYPPVYYHYPRPYYPAPSVVIPFRPHWGWHGHGHGRGHGHEHGHGHWRRGQ